jgi:hypothetical protein
MTNPELNRQHARELNRLKVHPEPNSGPIWFGFSGLIAGVIGVLMPYMWFILPRSLPIVYYSVIVLAIVLSAIGLRRGMSGRAMAGAGLALGLLLGADQVVRMILAASLRNVFF